MWGKIRREVTVQYEPEMYTRTQAILLWRMATLYTDKVKSAHFSPINKLNISKVKWTNSTLTLLWNLGNRQKTTLASSFYLRYKCKMTTHENKSVKNFVIILLPEKFLRFDWLRADVFQLNFKHLQVKITVTMVTQNHQIMSSHELRKNGGKILKIRRIKN